MPAAASGVRVMNGLLALVGGSLAQADGDVELGDFTGGGEGALDAVEVAAGVHGEAFGLGDEDPVGGPRVVGEFEDGADGSVGEDAGGAVVARDIQAAVGPDAGAAASAGGADAIHVHALALVEVVVVVALVIPAVDDRVVDALAPEVEAAGDEDLLGGARGGLGGERGAVGAVGEAVVFPGEVVETLGHLAGEGFYGEWRRDGLGLLDGEGRGLFAGGEVVLENEFAVSDADAIGVFGLGGDVGDLIREDAAGGVAHGDLLHEGVREGLVYLGPWDGDGLGRAGDG